MKETDMGFAALTLTEELGREVNIVNDLGGVKIRILGKALGYSEMAPLDLRHLLIESKQVLSGKIAKIERTVQILEQLHDEQQE